MDIVVLSGKGGTGKTTVATNLSKILNMNYLDCDVEEPNGGIFLKPDITTTSDVTINNPIFDMNKCTKCGKCIEACQFNALAFGLNNINLFSELCHGCGACGLSCEMGAISEEGRVIGKVNMGTVGSTHFVEGRLNIKEPMGGPVISKVRSLSYQNENNILDASPGTSCNVVKAIIDCDFAVLVTEATKFGLHDLKLAVELVDKMEIPYGVIINRYVEGQSIIHHYLHENNISLIGEIPFSIEAARLYSEGKLLISDSRLREVFEKIGTKTINLAGRRQHASSNC